MNKLEFDETIKATGHDKFERGLINNFADQLTTKYEFGDVSLFFSGSDYAVVKGKISLEVAKQIYLKYSKKQYGISVEGGSDDNKNPQECAIIDKYIEGFRDKAKISNKDSDENKFISTYHIDTKEGLVIFLLELDNYYCRKYGLQENNDSRYDEIISAINEGILDKIKPNITAYEWMKEDKKMVCYMSIY